MYDLYQIVGTITLVATAVFLVLSVAIYFLEGK